MIVSMAARQGASCKSKRRGGPSMSNTITIYSGQTRPEIILGSGDREIMYFSGTTIGATVNNGGTESLYWGGTAIT